MSKGAALTHRLLAFSRKQSLELHAVDVNALALGMSDLPRRALGEGVALRMSLADGLWAAHTDSNQLENALLNLAINARDAMPGGGRLTIETANLRIGEAGSAGGAELLAGDYVVASVSDTGHGMEADVVAKAFDPFFTTKPLGQGTGLGLSMIHGFAKQSGGSATIYSEPGRGATVKVFLPRAESRGERPAERTEAAPARGRGERVLVVDDQPDVLASMAAALAQMGYEPARAADADEALALLRAGPPFLLLVSDVGLPGMNGRELADSARALRPELPVLFVTGYAAQAAVRGDFLAAGMDMLSKPFAIDDLARRARSLIDAAAGI